MELLHDKDVVEESMRILECSYGIVYVSSRKFRIGECGLLFLHEQGVSALLEQTEFFARLEQIKHLLGKFQYNEAQAILNETGIKIVLG